MRFVAKRGTILKNSSQKGMKSQSIAVMNAGPSLNGKDKTRRRARRTKRMRTKRIVVPTTGVEVGSGLSLIRRNTGVQGSLPSVNGVPQCDRFMATQN